MNRKVNIYMIVDKMIKSKKQKKKNYPKNKFLSSLK